MESPPSSRLTACDAGGVHAGGAEGMPQQVCQHPVPAPSSTPPGEFTNGGMLTLPSTCPVNIPPPESGTTAVRPLVVTPCRMTKTTTGRNSHERYTSGNPGAAASDYPAGPVWSPPGDDRAAATVRC
jgi:hypothetical protein